LSEFIILNEEKKKKKSTVLLLLLFLLLLSWCCVNGWSRLSSYRLFIFMHSNTKHFT